MKKITLLMLLLLATRFNAQVEYVDTLNSHIANIPYIFEGQIYDVEVYSGKDDTEPLSRSNVQWEGRIGYFYDENEKEGYGYSRAKIRVCKMYKGTAGMEGTSIEILTKSFTIGNLYLEATADGDTLLKYVFSAPSHNEESYPVILPGDENTHRLFFIDRIDAIDESDYIGESYHSNCHSYAEIPLYVKVEVPKADGTFEKITAYAAIVPYVFPTETEMQDFLSLLNGIDPDPDDYCNLAIVDSNDKNTITISPNPSSINQQIKVSLKSETAHVVIKDFDGKIVFEGSYKEGITMPMDFRAGIYILQATSNGETTTRKIIKH